MTYQQQTAVVEITTAHGSSLFYFSYAAAVMIMDVAMVSLAEMMAADSVETIAHASLLFYFFFAAVAMATAADVAADANIAFHHTGEPYRFPFFMFFLMFLFKLLLYRLSGQSYQVLI